MVVHICAIADITIYSRKSDVRDVLLCHSVYTVKIPGVTLRLSGD